MADSFSCPECRSVVEDSVVFNCECGVELDKEKTIMWHYFYKGFEYEKIVGFLAKFQGN